MKNKPQHIQEPRLIILLCFAICSINNCLCFRNSSIGMCKLEGKTTKSVVRTELCQKLMHQTPRQLFFPFQRNEFTRRNVISQFYVARQLFLQTDFRLHQNNCGNEFLGGQKFLKAIISMIVGNRRMERTHLYNRFV